MQVYDEKHVIVQHHHGNFAAFVQVGLGDEGRDAQNAIYLQNSDHVQVRGRRCRIVEEREDIDPEIRRFDVALHYSLMVPLFLAERVQEGRAQVDKDVGDVQDKREEV